MKLLSSSLQTLSLGIYALSHQKASRVHVCTYVRIFAYAHLFSPRVNDVGVNLQKLPSSFRKKRKMMQK